MDIKSCKIVFMGTPQIAAQVLDKLISLEANITAVLTQPKKPLGRGLKFIISDVEKVAVDNNLPLFTPESESEIIEIVSRHAPDLLLVVAYGHILSKEVISLARTGSINIHGSLLPKYRGPSPIQTTILEGDDIAGITFQLMTEKMDEGAILLQKSVNVSPEETTKSLTEKLTTLARNEVVTALNNYLNNTIKPEKQNDKKATYCHLITKNDGLIDWKSSATTIDREIRAYTPWPKAFTYWKDKKITIIRSAHTDLKLQPGQVKSANSKLFVGTSTTALELLEIQPAGKNNMTAQDFLNGHPQIDNYNF